MTVEGAITALGNIVPGTIDALGRMFPGIALGSEDRAKSRSTKRALRDMEIVKSVGAEKGMSQEGIDALCSAIAKERVGCERLSSIISFTAELEPDVSRADEVDQSWTEAFRGYAERAVDEEAQRTWASVLLGELERPGSVSKKTMAILDEMTKMEASAFRRMCDCSIEARVSDGETRLVSFVWSEDIDDLSLTRDESESLDALGLTRMHTGGTYVYGNLPFRHDGTLEFSMAGKRYFVRKGEGSLHICYPDFTRYGRELARICGIGCDPRFQKDLFDWFDHWGADVTEIV